ncbi:MAG: ATP-dependent DNA helicase [Candidatus Coatesbacteria bacterium]
MFERGGRLSRELPDYTYRGGQLEMARAVAAGLKSGDRRLVEAGTGIGKSLAYLIPAALWAMENKKQVVVSTCTKALQEQLVEKDLPLVGRIMAALGHEDFRYALLMGLENYLCVQRLDALAGGHDEGLFAAPRDARGLSIVKENALEGGTALRHKVGVGVDDAVWSRICVDSLVCDRYRKSDAPGAPCGFRADRDRANAAHILVINHWLLMNWAIPRDIDDSMEDAEPPPGVLPFGAAIIDEAHTLEEVAGTCLGLEVTEDGIGRLLHRLLPRRRGGLLKAVAGSGHGPWATAATDAARQVEFKAAGFFEEMRTWVEGAAAEGEAGSRERRLTEPLIPNIDLAGALGDLADRLDEAEACEERPDLAREVLGLAARCRQEAESIRTILGCGKDGSVFFVAMNFSRQVTLRSLPIDVSTELRERFWDRPFPFILCSATLAAGDSCSHFRRWVGLADAKELIIESPFDWRKQALGYLAADLPAPGKGDGPWEAASVERAIQLAAAAPGGVLVLFTSWAHLGQAVEPFRRRFQPARAVLAQGDADPTLLLNQLRSAPGTILLGTGTFWQGIDVVGAALQCVIVTRIPFPSPASAYNKARQTWLQEHEIDPFQDDSLPRAIIKLRQAFGRLIRSETDTGVFALLDSRINTKNYGRVIMAKLPPARFTSALADAEQALRGG